MEQEEHPQKGKLKKLQRIFSDYFQVNRESFPDAEAYVQANIILSFVLVYAVCWASYVVLYFFVLNNSLAGAMCLFAGLPTAVVGAWMVKRHHRFYQAGILAHLGGCITLLGITAATGTVYSPIPAWLFFLTMTTFLCLGRDTGLIMVGLNVCGVLMIGALSIFGRVINGFEFKLNSTEFKIFVVWVYCSSITALGVVTMVYDFLVRRAFLEANRAKQKTEARSRDIRAILKNISTGIFTIMRDGRIHEDFSDYLARIIGRQHIAGEPALTTIFQASNLSADAFDQMNTAIEASLGEDELVFETNAHCLPREIQLSIQGGNRTIEVEWDTILDKRGVVDKILVSMKDVTEQRALSARAEQQAEEIRLMHELIEIDHQRFMTTYRAALKFIEDNHTLIKLNPKADPELLKVLFINMHTLKGDARSLRLSKVVSLAHAIEERYAKISKDKRSDLWVPRLMLRELEELHGVWLEYHRIATDQLGRQDDVTTVQFDKQRLELSLSAIDFDDLENLSGDNQRAVVRLLSELRSTLFYPLSTLFREFENSVGRLAKDLGKEVPLLDLRSEAYFLKEQGVSLARKVFIHLLRNAMDHGIEAAEERARHGKPIRGTIMVDARLEGAFLVLRVQDDGRGLNLAKIREKGIVRGLCRPQDSLQSVANLIFENELSTTQTVSEISGRGIGMSAVRRYLEEEGGSIDIVVDERRYIDGYAPFYLEIRMPSRILDHAGHSGIMAA